jgi:hypothetical protein
MHAAGEQLLHTSNGGVNRTMTPAHFHVVPTAARCLAFLFTPHASGAPLQFTGRSFSGTLKA